MHHINCIILPCGKHFHIFFSKVREEIWAYKINLIRHYYFLLNYMYRARKVSSICVKCIDFDSVSIMSRLDFGTVTKVWHFFSLSLNVTNEQREIYQMIPQYAKILKTIWNILETIQMIIHCIIKAQQNWQLLVEFYWNYSYLCKWRCEFTRQLPERLPF